MLHAGLSSRLCQVITQKTMFRIWSISLFALFRCGTYLGARERRGYNRHTGECTGQNIICKTIPVTFRTGPQLYETSKLAHSPVNRLTDGCEFFRITLQLPFNSKKILDIYYCKG
jgi:hypothetical protein